VIAATRLAREHPELRVDVAQVSLIGSREDNQDRGFVAVNAQAALLAVVDGMGGHAAGAVAAELACNELQRRFAAESQPLLDPLGFLHLALGYAHSAMVALGADMPMERRPRATCAVCLVQDNVAYWAHAGDSRVYLLRDGHVLHRTRDHSHVELLLQEGIITEQQAQTHPLRNFVEVCLGGEPQLPEMQIARSAPLRAGDVLLVCSDGFWSGLNDEHLARALTTGQPLQSVLNTLAERAVQHGGSHSDNTTAAVLRFKD